MNLANELLKKLPKNGFIKVVQGEKIQLDNHKKALLIRQANQFFNDGNVEMAGKIFISLRYSAGIIRLAQHYYQKNDFIRAMNLYKLAPDHMCADLLAQRMAAVLSIWIEKD